MNMWLTNASVADTHYIERQDLDHHQSDELDLDADQASQNDADTCIFGSTTQPKLMDYVPF